MKNVPVTTASVIALGLTMSACGGGGGVQSAGNVPVLPPQPAPTPALAAPTVALLKAVQTGSPPALFAAGTTPTLKAPGSTVVLPLLITAVEANFSGDRTTTNQGATLTVAANGDTSLKINNPAWDLPLVPFGSAQAGLTVKNGPYGAALDLDYTSFGGWYGQTLSNGKSVYAASGEWLGGFQTPVGAMPVSGSANYAGNVNGQYSLYSQCRCADFGLISGNVGMTASFGTGSVTGKMTNLLVVDGTGFNDPLNDILFSASIGSGSNKFVGTTSISGPPRAPSGVGTPSGLVGLGLNATGTVVGGFFGPTAQEAGAIWTIDDGAARVIGSFGAKTGN